METFIQHVHRFARQNLTWINKVGADVLAKSKLSVENYVKGIAGGTICFDELCVLIACHAFNIHCAVLLENSGLLDNT